MKKFSLLFIVSHLSCAAFAQSKPDTLIIETPQKQKIILIAEDVNSFRNLNSDSLINAALRKVTDSLSVPGRPTWSYINTLSKTERSKYLSRLADSVRRVNDSLQVIDGLSTEERRKKNREKNYSDRSLYSKNLKSNSPFTLKFNVGGGLVRNNFSPIVEGGLVFIPQKQDYYSLRGMPVASFISLTANRYYTFEQIPGRTTSATFNNTFLNLSLGNRFNTNLRSDLFLSEFEAGIGYQIERGGSYFGKNAVKLFGSIVTKSKFIRLSPEIFITDNFREVFPGFSIKLF